MLRKNTSYLWMYVLIAVYGIALMQMPQISADDVSIGSGNGFVPSDNTPSPAPILTKISNATKYH